MFKVNESCFTHTYVCIPVDTLQQWRDDSQSQQPPPPPPPHAVTPARLRYDAQHACASFSSERTSALGGGFHAHEATRYRSGRGSSLIWRVSAHNGWCKEGGVTGGGAVDQCQSCWHHEDHTDTKECRSVWMSCSRGQQAESFC